MLLFGVIIAFFARAAQPNDPQVAAAETGK
jgi:hypothetical protein